MNYLAHAYLSGDDKELLIGNFIADAVKGKAMDDYSENVRRGIVLHRAIDDFTDHHDLHRISRRKLHNRYGHYSGVLVDIFYDHFLAKNWSVYSTKELLEFTTSVYDVLDQNKDILPERINYMLRYMVPHNWLYNYQFLEGIRKVLNGMANRAKFESQMENGLEELEQHYDEFQSEFTLFFPDLKEYVHSKLLVI